jgi:hypothetical protein
VRRPLAVALRRARRLAPARLLGGLSFATNLRHLGVDVGKAEILDERPYFPL